MPRVYFLVLLFFPSVAYSFQDTTEFVKADSISQLYPRHSLTDTRTLSNKLTRDLSTETGKFRAIYKWVCINIANDYYLAETNRKKRAKLTGDDLVAWNSKIAPKLASTLIENYSTVCTGYAWLIKELAMHAGIESVIIHGYGRTTQANIGGKGIPNHSWNAVKLDNKWYLCDATWSSGGLNMQTASFVRNYEEGYFLAKPEYFVRNHYPLDVKWTLLDEPPTLDEFLNRPLIYSSSISRNIQPNDPQFEVVANKRSKVDFKFRSDKELENIKLIITSKDSYEQATRDSDMYTISHSFKSNGIFAVHILVEEKPVISYRVIVR